MPLIRVEFDDAKVQDDAVRPLSEAVRDIVARETGIDDVFVYANTARIKIQVAPVEIFIEMSADKIENLDALFSRVEQSLAAWKKQAAFLHPINLTIVPMKWKFKTGI